MAEPIVIHAETCNGDTYEIRYYRASDYDALAAENAALRSTIDDLTAGEIHTCHDHCQRTACILRRENTALRSRLADIESQNRVMWDVANDREARLAEQGDTISQLRIDVAEAQSAFERTDELWAKDRARLAEARANAFQDALDCMRDRQARDHLAACLQDKYGVWWKTDSASGDEGWGKVCAHCGRRYTRSLAQCPWIGCQTNADQPSDNVPQPTANGG